MRAIRITSVPPSFHLWKFWQKVESRYQQNSFVDAGARTYIMAPVISKPLLIRWPAVVHTRLSLNEVLASAACSPVVVVAPLLLAPETMKISADAQPLVVMTSTHLSVTSLKEIER